MTERGGVVQGPGRSEDERRLSMTRRVVIGAVTVIAALVSMVVHSRLPARDPGIPLPAAPMERER